MTTNSLSEFDSQLLRVLYGSFCEEDFEPEPPDPLGSPTTLQIERYGPLEARTDGPRLYADFHEYKGLLPSYGIYQGDSIEVLPLLGPQTVVTSPPYFRLRKYGDDREELGWGSLDHYIDTLCDTGDAVPPQAVV